MQQSGENGSQEAMGAKQSNINSAVYAELYFSMLVNLDGLRRVLFYFRPALLARQNSVLMDFGNKKHSRSKKDFETLLIKDIRELWT